MFVPIQINRNVPLPLLKTWKSSFTLEKYWKNYSYIFAFYILASFCWRKSILPLMVNIRNSVKARPAVPNLKYVTILLGVRGNNINNGGNNKNGQSQEVRNDNINLLYGSNKKTTNEKKACLCYLVDGWRGEEGVFVRNGYSEMKILRQDYEEEKRLESVRLDGCDYDTFITITCYIYNMIYSLQFPE